MRNPDEMCTEITRRLDDLETSLPSVPAKVVALGRATVHRVSETASGVASDVGRQLGQLSSTASTAVATSVGQTRSAAERTAETARRNTREAVGQSKAQTARTARQAGRSTVALLDDATRAVEPDGDGRPASLDDWTKAELYDRAQELDIDGRSTMNKQQLIRSIRAS